jgi:phosphate acetyltransferase
MAANVLKRLRDRARTLNARIAFPESEEPCILHAVETLVRERVVRPVLVGHRAQVSRAIDRAGVALPSDLDIVDPSEDHASGISARVCAMLAHQRTPPRPEAFRDPLMLATALVRTGDVDGCVVGITHTTQRVLKTALQVIGVSEATPLLTSAFLMILPDGRAMTFADCAVVPEPSAMQLAHIAVASAGLHEALTGETAAVAMLSFSTKGSAAHESVRKMQSATEFARQMAPDLAIDGELQVDAALIEAVAARKAPHSHVAGHANVLIFPSLDSGNIAYKIAERIGGAEAIGPLLQGLVRPLHDLSRGCKPSDVVNVACVCALQSGAARPTS